MDVGGFSVDGTIQYIGNHYYKVRANYEFNDIVDPGNKIMDWIFAIGAFGLLGPCENYNIKIKGTVEMDIFYYGGLGK